MADRSLRFEKRGRRERIHRGAIQAQRHVPQIPCKDTKTFRPPAQFGGLQGHGIQERTLVDRRVFAVCINSSGNLVVGHSRVDASQQCWPRRVLPPSQAFFVTEDGTSHPRPRISNMMVGFLFQSSRQAILLASRSACILISPYTPRSTSPA